jgi:hypothetical protein
MIKRKCVYCGLWKETTRDHVPPKSLFPKPRPQVMITVPACVACHDTTTEDDEYFRLMLSMSDKTGENPAVATIRDAALRSLTKPEAKGLLESFRKWVHPAEARSPSGLYLGQRMAFDVDLERLYRVAGRIVRGLFFQETRRTLSPTAIVDVFSDERINQERREVIDLFMKTIALPLSTQTPKVIQEGVFSYRFQLTEMPEASAWALVFYGSIPFLVMTLPESAKKKIAEVRGEDEHHHNP